MQQPVCRCRWKEQMRTRNDQKRRQEKSRSIRGVLLAAGLLIMSLALGGCAKLDALAVQIGLKESPYYHLGDTWWDHGGIEEYWFNQIPSDENEIYRELYERIRNYEDSAELYAAVPTEKFWHAYYAVMADHPEFFWVDNHVEASESALTGRVVSYRLGITVPVEEREQMKASLEAAADACINGIDPNAETYDKIKYVYEYLIDTTDYVRGSVDDQNIQSALLYHQSVCAGYSRAFQYILHRMGLFCTYVTGTITTGGDHAWNIVRIGDNYYHVDVTWGDPVFVGDEAGAAARGRNYSYLCCTDADLAATHQAEDPAHLPACTDESGSYYRRHGMYYESFDYNTIYNALMNSVYNDQASITMKFARAEDYQTAVYELFSNNMLNDAAQYLMQVYGMSTWNYRYYTDETFLLITIYWKQ